MGMAEHGLNPRGLVCSQNWASKARGQLDNSRSHLAWNEYWQHINPRMCVCGEGGTGFVLQGDANNRFISSQDNPDGLGRLTSVLLQGSEVKVIRSVSIYCLCPS